MPEFEERRGTIKHTFEGERGLADRIHAAAFGFGLEIIELVAEEHTFLFWTTVTGRVKLAGTETQIRQYAKWLGDLK